MDNFIDKLAQKFTAGEVIKANSVAEERELKRLREQATEYERCLQEMSRLQLMNTQAAQKLQELTEQASLNLQQVTDESLEKLGAQKAETDAMKEQRDEALDKARATAEEISAVAKGLTETMEEISSVAKGMTETIEEISTVAKGLTETIEEVSSVTKGLTETMGEVSSVTKGLTETMEKNQKEISQWFKAADDYLHRENVKVYRNVQAVVVEEAGKRTEAVIKNQEEYGKKYYKPIFAFALLTFLATAANLTLIILQNLGMLK